MHRYRGGGDVGGAGVRHTRRTQRHDPRPSGEAQASLVHSDGGGSELRAIGRTQQQRNGRGGGTDGDSTCAAQAPHVVAWGNQPQV